MTINFKNALGIHAQTLEFRSRRAEVLANNLINADTPNFKARDIRFEDALKSVASQSVQMRATNSRHMGSRMESISSDQLYRTPLQASVDGNTVNPEMEQSNYMRNAIEYQASFTFLNGKFNGLRSAIRGE